MSEEPLCSIGQKLWDNYSDKIYREYCIHIINCKECQDALDIDEGNVELLKSIHMCQEKEQSSKPWREVLEVKE